MTPEEAAAQLEKLLGEMVGRLDLFAFEYASANVSKAVWDEAERRVKGLLRNVDPDKTTGASVWRTRSRDGSQWLVIVCDDGLDLRRRLTFGAGVEYELDDRTRQALLERHLAQFLNQHDPESGRADYIAHYGLGAELFRGGVLRPRIGRDQ